MNVLNLLDVYSKRVEPNLIRELAVNQGVVPQSDLSSIIIISRC